MIDSTAHLLSQNISCKKRGRYVWTN